MKQLGVLEPTRQSLIHADMPIDDLFELESQVRYYSRVFPAVFSRAKNCHMYDTSGRDYLDFFSGAGALNLGHNNERLKERIIRYLEDDCIVHSLDMASVPKAEFLREFHDVILKPRNFDYKIQFCGPTGTNAIEAALKLARKITGRKTVVYFENSFHGMTLGSLSVSSGKQERAGIPLSYTVEMPFCDGDRDTIQQMQNYLEGLHRAEDIPAAIIVETIQVEGGLNVANKQWFNDLHELAFQYNVILIVDDIQVGCGRTGSFFSFDTFGTQPDIVCLSKSISGYGLPLAMLLIRPELDQWTPGEHSGTFRGNNLSLVAATEALAYWRMNDFVSALTVTADTLSSGLSELVDTRSEMVVRLKGRGLIQGIQFKLGALSKRVARCCFERGMIVETCGPAGETIKLMPPLTIPAIELREGIEILRQAIDAV